MGREPFPFKECLSWALHLGVQIFRTTGHGFLPESEKLDLSEKQSLSSHGRRSIYQLIVDAMGIPYEMSPGKGLPLSAVSRWVRLRISTALVDGRFVGLPLEDDTGTKTDR